MRFFSPYSYPKFNQSYYRIERVAFLSLLVIGCFLTIPGSYAQDIVITEIMYNPPESGSDSLEFVELYNASNNKINLNGYYFKSGVNFTFPEVSVEPKDYVVVCGDSIAILLVFKINAYKWSGSLVNGGEPIVLSNPNGITVDSVKYDDIAPWPKGPPSPNGEGTSIKLCSANLDNNNGINWDVSKHKTGQIINGSTIYASPGMEEFCCEDTIVSQTILTCDSFIFNGKTLKTSGSYTDTLTRQNTCDSIIKLSLTINRSEIDTQNVVACKSYQFGGEVLTTSGIYRDTLKNSVGCDSIILLNLTIKKVDTSVTLLGSSIKANASDASYEWLRCKDDNQTNFTGATAQVFDVPETGQYAVKVSQNGCVDTSSCIAMVATVSLNLQFKKDIKVFPSPTKGDLRFDLGQYFEKVYVELINAKGQVVISEQYGNIRKSKINIHGTPGIYYLKVYTGSGLKARFKVLKE